VGRGVGFRSRLCGRCEPPVSELAVAINPLIKMMNISIGISLVCMNQLLFAVMNIIC